MQIAGIRSAPEGRTIRPDATAGKTADAAPARDAATAAGRAAIAPLPPSPVRTRSLRPVVVAFPAGDSQNAVPPQPANDAQRAYRDMQAAAPRPALALVEDIATETAAPARAVRTARAGAPARDETFPDAPRPPQAGLPSIVAQGVAHSLSALLRVVAGQSVVADKTRSRKPAKATAARPADAENAVEQGGWMEAITFFTLVATVALALWLLMA